MTEEIRFETVPAYNTNKQFHPKENEWVGYIIEIKGIRYVAFVPVGGTYTMDFKETAYLINEIKPKIAIPTHY